MKTIAYMITISQAWEIINVINHISFICKYKAKQAGSGTWSKTSWFLYMLKYKEVLNSIYKRFYMANHIPTIHWYIRPIYILHIQISTYQ